MCVYTKDPLMLYLKRQKRMNIEMVMSKMTIIKRRKNIINYRMIMAMIIMIMMMMMMMMKR